MSLSAFLYSLASVPMFASRPFLAALVTSLLARYGTSIPWLEHSSVIQALHGAPEWFTSWITLSILGALTVLEWLSVKHSEVRAIMQELDSALKSAVAMLVCLAIIDKDTAGTVQSIHKAGLGFHSLFAGVVGLLTFGASNLRASMFGLLAHLDDHDDLGLQTLLHRIESSLTIAAFLVLALFPLIALTLAALSMLALWVMRKIAQRREERSKVPCAACGAAIFPHATRCSTCGAPLALPRAVGVFGQPIALPAGDVARHRFELVSRKRCPVCATRLTQRAVRQTCATCRTVTFASPADFERYVQVLSERLPRTVWICAAFSAIPIVGVIPGVIYYRLSVVTGLRGYTPPLRGCFLRVFVRVLDWVLILLQPIPVLGALVIPTMCMTTFWIYRASLRQRADSDFAEPVARAQRA
jgi:hypothetical protein